MPYNFFKRFKKACKETKKDVIPIGNVLDDAEKHFNLRNKNQLLDFIANNGLEDLEHVNTADWRNNPNPATPVSVYAYKFRAACKLGYIAIMNPSVTKKWLIKSFHISKDTNDSMKVAFQKALNQLPDNLKEG